MDTLNQVSTVITNPVDQVKAYIQRETYGFVNTKEVLGAFEASGWTPVNTSFGKVRTADRVGFQKHLIRLENPAYPRIEGLTDNNNSKPQLVVLNSHDGTSSLQILWGLFRIACANGIIAGVGVNGMRLVHSKSIVDRLPDAIKYMLDNFGTFQGQIQALQGKTMSLAAQSEFIRRVYDARLSNVQNVTHVSYDLGRLNRVQDNASDAYTVFNRVQERLMRGGIAYEYNRQSKDDMGQVIGSKLISTHTRKIASVASQVKLNQLAYDSALELAA